MTRTLSQKALEKAAGEIHLATGEKMEWARPIARSAIAAYLDEVEREAPASAPTPTGWRLVPIEPTKRMLIDGVCALTQFQVIGSRIGFSNIGDTYRAMIDAAPEPPAPAGWRLVPVEPDEMQVIKMRDAFKATRVSGVGGQTIDATFAADYAREIAAYRAALAAVPEPPVSDGWRDIASAPKDGTMIIAYRPTADNKCILKVGPDYWGMFGSRGSWGRSNAAHQPTHWQPLPATPKGRDE